MSAPSIQLMGADGSLAAGARVDRPRTQLLELFRLMTLARELDRTLADLARARRITIHAPTHGEEALAVGASAALGPEDRVFAAWREVVWALARGAEPAAILTSALGRGPQRPPRYADERIGFPSVSPSPRARLQQAVGVAWAARLRDDPTVVLATCGPAARDDGSLDAALRLARSRRLPLVTLFEAGDAAPGKLAGESVTFPVHDVLAVIQAVEDAVRRARDGEGPTLLVSRRGRDIDPVALFRRFLTEQGHATSDLADDVAAAARRTLAEALDDAASRTDDLVPSPFDHILATEPAGLHRQRTAFERFGAEYGGAHDPEGEFLAGEPEGRA